VQSPSPAAPTARNLGTEIALDRGVLLYKCARGTRTFCKMCLVLLECAVDVGMHRLADDTPLFMNVSLALTLSLLPS